MYIIDRLMLLRQNDHVGTDHELAVYFLNHIDKIQHKSLNQVLKDTAVSKASVYRFCKKAGFVGYREFVTDLDHEYQLIYQQKQNRKLINNEDYHHYLDMCVYQSEIQILAQKIKTAKRLVIFGHIEYIQQFENLFYYCLLNRIEMLLLLSWEQEENLRILRSLNNRDVFLIIDVDYTFATMWENVMDRSYLPELNIVCQKDCSRFFIGQVKQKKHDFFIQIHIPFHQDINLKKCGLLFFENQLINALERKKK